MRAYLRSSEPSNPILNVSNGASDFCLWHSLTSAVIKLLSNPPDNKHAIGLSVTNTRFLTASYK